MARLVDPPNDMGHRGKHCYMMWQTIFEIDTKYVPIKPIGRRAYGIVCSSINRETNEKAAIKKINNAFENRVDALRTLRELKLLCHLRHENVIALKDIMMPVSINFKDVYLVYELINTDLHQIIKSSQALSNDHCRYFLFQARILALNASYFLKNEGHFVISIKANCIDSTVPAEAVFAQEVKKLQAEQFKPEEQVIKKDEGFVIFKNGRTEATCG